MIELGEEITMISSGWANPHAVVHRRASSPRTSWSSSWRQLIAAGARPVAVGVQPARAAGQHLDRPGAEAGRQPEAGGQRRRRPDGCGRLDRRARRDRALPAAARACTGTSTSPAAASRSDDVCINPGSEYGEGILRGALLDLDRKKGIRSYQLHVGLAGGTGRKGRRTWISEHRAGSSSSASG